MIALLIFLVCAVYSQSSCPWTTAPTIPVGVFAEVGQNFTVHEQRLTTRLALIANAPLGTPDCPIRATPIVAPHSILYRVPVLESLVGQVSYALAGGNLSVVPVATIGPDWIAEANLVGTMMSGLAPRVPSLSNTPSAHRDYFDSRAVALLSPHVPNSVASSNELPLVGIVGSDTAFGQVAVESLSSAIKAGILPAIMASTFSITSTEPSSVRGTIDLMRASGLRSFIVSPSSVFLAPLAAGLAAAGMQSPEYNFLSIPILAEGNRNMSGWTFVDRAGPVGSIFAEMTQVLSGTDAADPPISLCFLYDEWRVLATALNATIAAGFDPTTVEGRNYTRVALDQIGSLELPGCSRDSLSYPLNLRFKDFYHYRIDEAGSPERVEPSSLPLLPTNKDAFVPDTCLPGDLFVRPAVVDPQSPLTCVLCPIGQYNPNDGKEACLFCRGEAVLSGSICTPCPAFSFVDIRPGESPVCVQQANPLVIGLVVGVTFVVVVIALVWAFVRSARVQQAAAEAVARTESASSEQMFRMLSLLSHEVRTPLQIIVLSNDALEVNVDKSLARYVESVRSGAKMLDGVLSQVVDAAKLKRGTVTLLPSPFCMRALLVDCLRATESIASPGVDVIGQLHDGIACERLPLVGDARRVQQVMMNLINNACKFTERGHILVNVRWDGDSSTLTVKVEDSGVGVPIRDRPQLFKEFEQVDANRATVAGGTGLGLFIVKELALLMRGEAHFDAIDTGGSRFTVSMVLERDPRGEPGPSLTISRPRSRAADRPVSIGIIVPTPAMRDAYTSALTAIAPFASIVHFSTVDDAVETVGNCSRPRDAFLLFVDASLVMPADHVPCKVVLLGQEVRTHVDAVALKKSVASWLNAASSTMTREAGAPRRRRSKQGAKK